MKKSIFFLLYITFFAGTPLLLIWNQDVPTYSTFQKYALGLSLSAFGLLIGQFWLSRLLPSGMVNMKTASLIRWHKVLGYLIAPIMLVHPLAMIARRFWVLESQPMDNFVLMLQAPALRPAIAAWILLVLIIVLSILRRVFPYKMWKMLHGATSIGFIALATWHVVSIGRHSNQAMSAFWIVLASGAIATLLISWIFSHKTALKKGSANECIEQSA